VVFPARSCLNACTWDGEADRIVLASIQHVLPWVVRASPLESWVEWAHPFGMGREILLVWVYADSTMGSHEEDPARASGSERSPLDPAKSLGRWTRGCPEEARDAACRREGSDWWWGRRPKTWRSHIPWPGPPWSPRHSLLAQETRPVHGTAPINMRGHLATANFACCT
jgi:hypothetical protein